MSVAKAFGDLAELPETCYQLTDTDVIAATQLVLAMFQRAERVSVALTSAAIARGLVERSTAASTKQWVQRLATGEPLAHLRPAPETSGPLVTYDDPSAAATSPAPPVEPAISPDSPVEQATSPLEPVESTAPDSAPCPRMPGVEGAVAHRIASLATECRLSRNTVVREALHREDTSPAAAHVAIRQAGTMSRLVAGATREEMLGYYPMLPVGHTSRDVRALTQQIIATYGGPEMLDDSENKQQQCESLSWRPLPTGMIQLIAELSAAHAAEVRHAIQASSAPTGLRRGREGASASRGANDRDVTGDLEAAHALSSSAEADPRTAGKRRADALLELIDIAARTVDEGRSPSAGSARLIVTFDYQVLIDALTEDTDKQHLHARLTDSGDLLNPATIRRMACDASLIPIILGGDGVPIDVGKEERLYTRALRQAVINRDRECTFPGCDRPPSFCQVHHIVPWWCGGDTSLANGTLLCRRHHTVVHRDRLTASLVDGRVQWDPTPGRMPLIPAHHAA